MIPYHGHPDSQDEAFIDLIRSGGAASEAAMKALYLQHRKAVHSYIVNLIQTHPAYKGSPDDILHDAFILLIRKIERDEFRITSLFLFWKGISRNLLASQWRKDHRIILVRDEESIQQGLEDSAEEVFLAQESREALLACFNQLRPRYRELLFLWLDRYTTAEITSRMQLSSNGMTRKMKYNCFKKLKEMLNQGNKTPTSRHNRE